MVQSLPVNCEADGKISCTSYSNMDFSLFEQPFLFSSWISLSSFESSMDLYCERYFEFNYLHTVNAFWGHKVFDRELHPDFWSSSLPSRTLENKKEVISYILLFRNNLLYIIHQSISRLSYDYI